MTNSQRLRSLIRGGNLYLSVEDALALAIENNLIWRSTATARCWRIRL